MERSISYPQSHLRGYYDLRGFCYTPCGERASGDGHEGGTRERDGSNERDGDFTSIILFTRRYGRYNPMCAANRDLQSIILARLYLFGLSISDTEQRQFGDKICVPSGHRRSLIPTIRGRSVQYPYKRDVVLQGQKHDGEDGTQCVLCSSCRGKPLCVAIVSGSRHCHAYCATTLGSQFFSTCAT